MGIMMPVFCQTEHGCDNEPKPVKSKKYLLIYGDFNNVAVRDEKCLNPPVWPFMLLVSFSSILKYSSWCCAPSTLWILSEL